MLVKAEPLEELAINPAPSGPATMAWVAELPPPSLELDEEDLSILEGLLDDV